MKTLADLDLKVGDPVLETESGHCALVCNLTATTIAITLWNHKEVRYSLSEKASKLKKLEVPK